MADTVKTTHPIRGLLWGLMMGIGLAFVLVISGVIYLDLVTMIIVVVAMMVVGVLWGLFGPAKAPKGPPPERHDRPAPPEASRFDDFETAEEEATHQAAADEPIGTGDDSVAGADDSTEGEPAPADDESSDERPG